MNKPEAFRFVAKKGYDVGFGAKKHFATFDFVEKLPGTIGFIATLFGLVSSNYLSFDLAGHTLIRAISMQPMTM